MPIKDPLEMLVKIFHGNGTQLMEDASHFDPIVGVRIAPILGGHQQAVSLCAVLMQFGGIVMAITESTNRTSAGTSRNRSGAGSLSATLAGVSSAATGNQTAATTETTCSFQPETKALPTRFGPMGLGINRRMGDFPFLAMLLMPDPSSGLEDGPIDGHSCRLT